MQIFCPAGALHPCSGSNKHVTFSHNQAQNLGTRTQNTHPSFENRVAHALTNSPALRTQINTSAMGIAPVMLQLGVIRSTLTDVDEGSDLWSLNGEFPFRGPNATHWARVGFSA